MLLLPATLTAREARDTLRLLKQAMESEGGQSAVVVEAGPLTQLDSAALAVLLELQRLAEGWARPFSIRNAPMKLAAMAKLYGVDVLLFEPQDVPAIAMPNEVDAIDAVGTTGTAAQRKPAT